MAFLSMPAIAPAVGRAGVTEATKNPVAKKAQGLMGLSPEAWLTMAAALGRGATGGGWGEAAAGMADAARMQREQTEGDARTDAQQRATARMLTGDMKGAMAILASAKGLEGDAFNMATNLEGRDYERSESDRRYDRDIRRDDQVYGRGRRDQQADYDRNLRDSREDMTTQRNWVVDDREDLQSHQRGLSASEMINNFRLAEFKERLKGPEFGDENGLRNQYLGQAKTFQDTARAANAVRSLSAEMNPAEQMALIFSTMKMLDPGSTVREGEYANAQNTTGAMGQLWNMYNKAKDGKFLDPTQINNFRNMVESQYVAAEESYGRTYDHYRGLAERYRMDPDMIQDFRLQQRGGDDAGGDPLQSADIPGALQGKLSQEDLDDWATMSPRGRELLWQKYMGTPFQQRGLRVPGQRGTL